MTSTLLLKTLLGLSTLGRPACLRVNTFTERAQTLRLGARLSKSWTQPGLDKVT